MANAHQLKLNSKRDSLASRVSSSTSEDRTQANAPRIHGQVRVVFEAANGPMAAEANDVLEDRGVLVIPDILANAGGVTCSYFEQVQGNANYYWRGEEVLRQVDSWMTKALKSCPRQS